MDWGTPLIFYKNICHGSESKGFKNSDYDDYMFTNGTIMVILWVGDCIFYAKEDKEIDAVTTYLKDKFLFEREEDVARFM